jgi:hypothetical protein
MTGGTRRFHGRALATVTFFLHHARKSGRVVNCSAFAVGGAPVSDCLSEQAVTDLLFRPVADDQLVNGHLDQCLTCRSVVAAALAAHPPTTPMRFSIVRQLGVGGIGTVYEAFDRERNTRVALKVLRRVSSDAILRFKREFRSLQGLHHPNLVRLGELVVDGDQWSFTMELLEGLRFVDHLRLKDASAHGAPGFDEARLRDDFTQLVHGLCALHAAGKIHRDIKSSNVLVTHAGRVVLLDLGLVLDQDSDDDSSDGYVLGTVAYMAPEQALGHRVGPEADWYAVGVMLYEALTGKLPFTGSSSEVSLNKQRGQPVPPRALLPSIDPALNDLCLALLQPDPAARPVATDILLALGSRHAPSALPQPAYKASDFVGRRRELEVLARALDDTRQGQPIAVFVTGDSGIGKSALVQRFAETSRGDGTVVLAGRCYERESLPFKAIDGIVDALSRHLGHLPAVEAASVMPRQAALLARAFPVLAGVKAIATAPHGFDVQDPQQLRARVFEAFRELLARLADRHPLLLTVDDAHWADVDSFALLGELFRQPGAPAVLLVATVRASADGTVGAHLATARSALGTTVRTLDLSAMTMDEAHALATLLIARHAGPSELDPVAVANEANGHPLFIDELIRHKRVDPGALRLDDVLWARISQLEPAARTILQLAAISGGRLMRRIAARAARFDRAIFEDGVSVLRASNLARTTGAADTDHLEPYHDRVRAAVLAHTGTDEACLAHRELALALEAEPRPDPEALVLHWRETGECDRAAEYAAEAGTRASRTLAFDRAAQLYGLALELRAAAGTRNSDAERELRTELGHALANAGRGGEAAKAYLAAAETVTASDGPDLRRRAAEQLIRSGHIDEGIATLRTALQPFGVKVAAGPMQALRSLIIRRLRVRLRGLRYREREAAEVPARSLTRIDFLWSLSSSLSFVDPLLGSDLNALHLLLALRAGELSRVCRAIASEAAYSASVGARSRARRWRTRAHDIAGKVNQPYTSGVVSLCDGIMSALLGEFAESHGHMEQAQQTLRAGATGVAWELDAAQDFELDSLAWMGRFDELRRRVPLIMREADGRGDLYFSNSLRTGLANNLVLLQRNEVAQARADAAEALSRWSRSGFQMLQFWNLYVNVQIDLYSGDIEAGYARLNDHWPQVKSALQMRVQYLRIAMNELRVRCMLGAAKQRAIRAPSEARALLGQAERHIKRLRRERIAWASALAWMLDAGLAHVRADEARAQDKLRQAAKALDAVDMALFAAVARSRLTASSDARADAEQSERGMSWFTRNEVASPRRMSAMLTPGFE